MRLESLIDGTRTGTVLLGVAHTRTYSKLEIVRVIAIIVLCVVHVRTRSLIELEIEGVSNALVLLRAKRLL